MGSFWGGGSHCRVCVGFIVGQIPCWGPFWGRSHFVGLSFGVGSHLGSFPTPHWVLFWGLILGGVPYLGLCGVYCREDSILGSFGVDPIFGGWFWGWIPFGVISSSCLGLFWGVLFWGPMFGEIPTVGFFLGWGIPFGVCVGRIPFWGQSHF